MFLANYGQNGYIDFTRLWELVDKKNLNKQWLKNNGIHSNTVAKLTKNENVTCDVICNLCKLLDCQPGQIMEYKQKQEDCNQREKENEEAAGKKTQINWAEITEMQKLSDTESDSG